MEAGILILFTLLLPGISAGVCLPKSQAASPVRYFYCQERNLPIILETSSRVSHQIVTNILQILLKEKLGYRDVPIYEKEDMNATVIMNRLAGCHPYSCQHSLMDGHEFIPETMVNVGVWLAAGFSKSHWTDHKKIADCGPLGPFGRLGWFMPSERVEEFWRIGVIADHWRALQLENVLQRFSLTDVMDQVIKLTRREGSQEAYCNHPECDNGLFYGPGCKQPGKKCATLVSSYPAIDQGVLIVQVERLRLPVVIAWIGPNLTPFVQDRTENGLPTLFFDWQTNTLTSSGNFTRLKFPTCTTVGSQLPQACDYDVNQLTKLAWWKIKKQAPEAFHLISHMTLSQEQYQDIALTYNDNKGQSTIAELACDWVKQNRAIWNPWISKHWSNKTSVILGGLFPISGQYLSQPGLVQAAEMAIELINGNSSILPNHNLDIIISDTKCTPDVATRAFMKYINTQTHGKLAGILGPACSDAAEPIAALAKHFNMITVSYEAEAMSLADRTRYPYFFRTIPQIFRHRYVYADFFRAMGWKQVGTLSESGQELPEYHILLQDYLDNHGITIPVKRKILRAAKSFDLSQVFAEIREKNVRIIICDMFEPAARAVMCEAYRQKMTAYDGYVWFLPAWFSEEWSDVDYFNRPPTLGDSRPQEDTPCTTEQMTRAIEGHFVLSKAFYDSDDTVVVGGLTVKQYRQEYERRVGQANVDSTPFNSYVYDAVWTWAFALDKLFKEQPIAIEHLLTKNTTEALMDAMNKTNFQGVTGLISFKGADRIGILTIEQHFHNQTNLVGRYWPARKNGYLQLINHSIVWLTPDGSPPHDGRQGIHFPEPVHDPNQCRVEALRLLLNVSCDVAITILNVSVFTIVIIITIALVLALKRRYDSKMKAHQKRMKELGLIPSVSSYLQLDEWEIPRDNVVINRRLGEGAFGTVFGGETHFDMEGWVAVAVKTLKIGAKIEEKVDFLSEAEMMKRYKHPNIVELLGVCTKGEPAYAIMEFMLHGDLKTYLLSRRNLVGQDTKEAEDVTARRLTQMALDVANGMKYLHDHKYVHRDLASRNCLVHASKTVKIGDFGMTRPMTNTDYYRFNKKGILPVRWMSPESLCDGIFTAMSDVWSYGVLIYEIVTFGSFPYQGLSNNQVLDYVKMGQKLAPPENCPELVKDFIGQCIEFNPKDRLRADEIIEILSKEKEFLEATLDTPSSAVVMECTDTVEIKSSNQNTVTRSSTLNFPINSIYKRSSSSHEKLALLRSNLHVPYQYVKVATQNKSPSPRSTLTESSTPDRQRRHSIATLLHTPRNSMSPSQSQTQLSPLLGGGIINMATARTPPPQAAPPIYQVNNGDTSSDYYSDNSKEMCQAITTV